MALQQINWTQIDTTNVPSGSVIDIGAISGPLHAGYFENLYISGLNFENYIGEVGGVDSLNLYTASLNQAIQTTGSNLTIIGDLLVKGTTTSVNSNVIDLGDNIISLNGSEGSFGGLYVNDPSNPSKISGSLLWDSVNDYWIAGPSGSEEKIVLIGELTTLSSSLSSSINDLSQSVSTSFDQVNSDLLNLSSSLSSSISELSGSVNLTFITVDNRLDDLESFSSSLDANFATDQQLTELSQSVSESLQQLRVDIDATNIFQQTGSYYSTSENLQLSGSGLDSPDGEISGKYGVIVSHSLHAENINVGTPTSNDWQSNLEGSYFNNFNHNTDVSEILRFVAGLLSSSAPDASPNTKFYNGYTKNTVNSTTGTVTGGRIPQDSTNDTITYLISKGFASEGSTIFGSTGTIYINNSYGHTYTSVAGGTTLVSSSVDSQLFGLGQLSSGTPTTFKVSGSFDFKFMDNSSKTLTAQSSSNHLITQNGEGTTSGVSLAKILTVNPNVIPPAYQDGKFVSVFSPTIYNGGATAVSSSGYYEITGSISISSGSGDFSSPIETYTQIFYSPLSTISSNIPAQTPTFSGVTTSALTAVSRSLSGAPYLTSATYNISGSILGIFDPMFYNGTIATITDNDSLVSESGVTTVSTNNGTISTSNSVYDSTGVTVRSTGTIPYETDIVKVNAVATFNPSTNENINSTGLGTTSFQLYINGYNKNGTITTNTSTLNYHTPGDFGQPSASGSLAYYGRTQGTDTATTLVESFLGENYRLQLNDNILSFNGDAWNTTFGLYNLGNQDLQIKPGFLVKPGGTYGYWLTNPSSASDYKYYIRKFSTSGTKTSMTINLGRTLSTWSSTTSNSVSAVVMFESSNNTIYSNARVYDPTETLSNSIGTINSGTDGTNPFGSTIDLYGNTGGSLSSTTYTMPIRNADGMFINSSYDEIYLIIRYKGDPSPITGITIAFS